MRAAASSTSTQQRPSLDAARLHVEHVLLNRPVVLPASTTGAWRARREWVDGTSLNFEALRGTFGRAEVPVAVCDERAYSDQPRRTMLMNDFLTYLARSDGASQEATGELLYLKDWHLQLHFADLALYEAPAPFDLDWINSFWVVEERGADDYRFCYIGPDGSWTPLHADVFQCSLYFGRHCHCNPNQLLAKTSSFSWSANVLGEKEWILYAPDQRALLENARGELPYDVRAVSATEFPRFAQAEPLVLHQRVGEVVFVPSGWYHQVRNIGLTVSINHNWGNEANVAAMAGQLLDDHRRVQRGRYLLLSSIIVLA